MRIKKGIIVGSSSITITLFRLPLIKEIIKRGHEIQVWGPFDEDSEKVISTLESLNIKYNFIKINNTSLNILDNLQSILSIIRLLKKERPDFLILHTIKPIIYGSLCGFILGINEMYSLITGLGYVFTEKSYFAKVIKFFVTKIYKSVFVFNTRVFFQNSDDRKIFDPFFLNHRFEVVAGSGVDTNYYSYSPSKEGRITFLFIGRLIKHKGITEFVEAAKMIKRVYKETSFVVVGRLTDNPSCISKKTLEEWEQKKYITYKGYQEDVRPFLKESSVFVLPSYREGIPKSILEAMSMGRPIITTDVPGCRETVIDGVNGFLVQKQNYEAIVAAMKKFIENSTLLHKMGRESRKMAEEKYNLEKINAALLKGMGFLE